MDKGGDGSQKVGLMALRCNPAQKPSNVQEGFVEYLFNESCKREHVVTSPRLPGYNFSFLYKLLVSSATFST